MTEPSGILPSRAVVDPNVFVSALVSKPGSPSLAVAQAAATGTMTLVACPHLLEELAEVLLREQVPQVRLPRARQPARRRPRVES